MPAISDAQTYLAQARLYENRLESAKTKFAEHVTAYGVEHAMTFVAEELVAAEYDAKAGRVMTKMLDQGLTLRHVMLEIRKSSMRMLTGGRQHSSLFARGVIEAERSAAVRWLEEAEGWLDQ
jgi:hypothetical protein